jgi:AcrR family transcriptional regulator
LSKGERTKNKILRKAAHIASVSGLEDMSIGKLAEATGLSKSGLFAHFNSKEKLQIQVVHWVEEMFTREVLRPAFKKSRGIPRIEAIYGNWKKWIDGDALPGGCIMIASSAEFDDRPGIVRDEIVKMMNGLLETLARAAGIAIGVGDFRPDTDPMQFAFEFESILHGYHLLQRLLNDPNAVRRSDIAMERLLSAYQSVDQTADRKTH